MTDQTTLRQEIEAEQRHLDRVYARLAQLRRLAARAEQEGYQIARVGNLGALVERDAMVYHAARLRQTLDAEHEGLVFGRLDLRTGQVLHIGRLGVRGEHAEPLVIDWRAPAAAAFYQATPTDPRGVVRRRMISTRGERVTRIEDDLLDPAAAPPGMRVVGDGALLAWLRDERQVQGTGVEISDGCVIACVRRGVEVIQQNLEDGLALFDDGQFDTVVLSQTLQSMHHTEHILREMMRVGRHGVVSFPNFGYWTHGLSILRGRMPVTGQMPYEWYNTPNIHLCTLQDFERLAHKLGMRIVERATFNGAREVRVLPGWRSTLAVYRLTLS